MWLPMPPDTHHVDKADGGLHVVGLGHHDLGGGEHLHQCLILLQRHCRWVGHLDPDGEGEGLGVLLEHLWVDTKPISRPESLLQPSPPAATLYDL